jgi:hypothetical protein
MVFELEIPKKQFLAHLGLLNNNRIIFSGAFGTGKTYFLEKFFDKEDSEYEAIHLFPVNYSVASNEDIFELIKYDILFKLLEKGLAFDNMSISKVAFLPFFLKEHGTDLIPLLLGAIPKVGGSLKNISEGLINLNKAFKNEYKDLNFTDEDRIISYLDSFNDKKGSINEEDFFTQLICELVKQLKDKGKEAVLIIDDLDRIDPEHIFRILNVLAAHVDVKKDSDKNKFNFSRIILVCDIENIRKMFANRYGVDVDFSGYIDKFYSRSIFHYDLSAEMIKSVNQVFHSVVLDYGRKEMSLGEVRKDAAGAIIKQLLHSFIQYNLISIRVLKRLFSGKQNLKERAIWRKGKHDSLTNNDIEMVKAVDFLLYLFQDYDVFLDKCEYLIGRDIMYLSDISNDFFMNELVKAAVFKEYYVNTNKNRGSEEKKLEFVLILDEKTIKYKIERKFDSSNFSDFYFFSVNSVVDSSGSEIQIDNVNLFQLLSALLKQSVFKSLLNMKFEEN